MYGIVNKAVESLVIHVAGEAAWKEMTAAAGFPNLTLCDTENYSDDVTLNIALETCEYLDMNLDTLLHTLGKYWFSYTKLQGWHSHFKLAGENFIDVLHGLDSLHANVKDAMPDANMPAFAVFPHEQGYKLEYHSTREGFAPMVIGILESLAESLEEKWQIEHIGQRSDVGFDTFLLRSVSEIAVGSDAKNVA